MGKVKLLLMLAAVAVTGLGLPGCPSEPQLEVSVATLHFGVVSNTYETQKTFQVWNGGASGTSVVFNVSADKPWITVSPQTGAQSTGADDKVTVTVTIDRAYTEAAKEAGYASGTITVDAGFDTQTIAVTTAPEYFTEAFSAGTNLDNVKLTFTPSGGPSFYSLSNSAITAFPTDPTGGLVLDFGAFGDPIKAAPFGDSPVPFYGQNYDTLYISSKGWISFGEPGNDPTTLGNHFKVPQISALSVDATQAGSTVSFLQDEDKLVVTYENVPTLNDTVPANDFQVELFFDGRIEISYLNVDPAMSGVLGLSNGLGVNGLAPSDFVESTLNTGSAKAAL